MMWKMGDMDDKSKNSVVIIAWAGTNVDIFILDRTK